MAIVFSCLAVADIFLFFIGVSWAGGYLAFLVASLAVCLYIIFVAFPTVAEEDAAPANGGGPALFDGDGGAAVFIASEGVSAGSGAGWVNTLTAQIGPTAISPLPDGADALRKALAGRMIAVVPSAAVDLLIRDKASADALFDAAADGVVVVVDNPGGEAARLIGIEPGAGTVHGFITYVYSAAMEERRAEMLSGCPCAVEVRPPVRIHGGYAEWMRVSERPAVIARQVGRGAIIATLFDYSEFCGTMRQGAAEESWTAAITGARPHKRALRELCKNDIPYADLLDDFMAGLAARYAPVARWWPHADGAPSTLVVTCDDDFTGRKSEVALNMLKDAGASPTFFIQTQSRNFDQTLKAAGGAAKGLLWNRFGRYYYQGGFRSNARAGISDQMESLRKKCGGEKAQDVCRVFQHRWDGGLDRVFGLMREAGVKMDSSFGPGPGRQGYVFATGFPFRPVTDAKKICGVFELPYQVHDSAGAPAPEWVDDFVDAAAVHGSAMTLALRPRMWLQNRFVRESAIRLIRRAADAGMKFTDAGGYADFWSARASSGISWKRGEKEVAFDVEAAGGGMMLRLPDKLLGVNRSEVLMDGAAVPAEKIKDSLIAVIAGKHEIVVKFEK